MPQQIKIRTHRQKPPVIDAHRAQPGAALPVQPTALPASYAAHSVGQVALSRGAYDGYVGAGIPEGEADNGAPLPIPYRNQGAQNAAYDGYVEAGIPQGEADDGAPLPMPYRNQGAQNAAYDGYVGAGIPQGEADDGAPLPMPYRNQDNNAAAVGYSSPELAAEAVGYSSPDSETEAVGYSAPSSGAGAGAAQRNQPWSGAGKYRTKELSTEAKDLDSKVLRQPRSLAKFHPGTTATSSKTYIPATDDKASRFDTSFGTEEAKGKLLASPKNDGGAQLPLDTIGAQAPAAIGSKSDRFIYVMDGKGDFRTADPMAENTDAYDSTRGTGVKRSGEAHRVHHSTLPAGKEVAGAGEVQARKGKPEILSDRSGHYQPDMGMTANVAKELSDRGADMEALSVEISAKTEDQKDMRSSGLEMLAYHDGLEKGEFKHDAEGNELTDQEQGKAAEAKLRELHGKKDNAMDELKRVAGAQQLGDSPRDDNLKPSQMNHRLMRGELKQAAREQQLDTDSLQDDDNLRPSQMKNPARWRKPA
jgi:hypothetical protein